MFGYSSLGNDIWVFGGWFLDQSHVQTDVRE